jgi:hypothetical protein
MYIGYNYCMSILYLHYDKFYILWVVLTLYGLTECIINEWNNEFNLRKATLWMKTCSVNTKCSWLCTCKIFCLLNYTCMYFSYSVITTLNLIRVTPVLWLTFIYLPPSVIFASTFVFYNCNLITVFTESEAEIC